MTLCAVAVNSMALTEKLPNGDARWGSFNGAFANMELDPCDLASDIYLGKSYTSWHRPCYRTSENWELSQFIAVDMDTEDQRSTFSYLLGHDFVMAYATLLHTTPSHTPDAPRCRIVFFLDRPIAVPASYQNACKFLTQVMGGDGTATDVSRFFYGNRNAEIELLHNTLPVDTLYALYQRHRKRLEAQASVSHAPQASTKSHSNPNEDKWQTVSECLKRIDPWQLSYEEWVQVIAACKYELGPDAIGMVSAWANGKKGEVEKMWRSFRRESGRISKIGTIVKFAKDA